MVTKAPNPIDVRVGGRVRIRRVLVGMSQEKLGAALGITFQQIQKYEKGTNRIGASRMQEICRVLDAPVSYFFGTEGENEKGAVETTSATQVLAFLDTAAGVRLNKAFVRIADPRLRSKLIELAEALADSDVAQG